MVYRVKNRRGDILWRIVKAMAVFGCLVSRLALYYHLYRQMTADYIPNIVRVDTDEKMGGSPAYVLLSRDNNVQ